MKSFIRILFVMVALISTLNSIAHSQGTGSVSAGLQINATDIYLNNSFTRYKVDDFGFAINFMFPVLKREADIYYKTGALMIAK